MKAVPITDAGASLYLDVCTTCYFIWFDPREFEAVAKTDQDLLTQQELSAASEATLARTELKLIQEARKAKSIYGDSPETWWEVLLAVFGLPVEYDDKAIVDRPIMTWALAGLMVLVYFATFSDLKTAAENWGLVPADLYRRFGATFITSFLLHGGFFHLLGNLYFFLVFGDNVEEDMGRPKYVLLIAASALLGDAFHILADPRSSMPLIGASAGISGIMVYYALQFPTTRIGMLICFRWFRVPAGVMIVLWLIAQVAGVLQQLSGYSNVSALGHLGGACAGFLFWLYSRQSLSPTEKEKPAVGI